VLILKGLPFTKEKKVEIIIIQQKKHTKSSKKYPMRGQPFQLIDPFKPVAEEDWNVLQ